MKGKLKNDEYLSLKKFNGRLASCDKQRNEINYNKKIINRWNVLLMLHYNKVLIQYRKHNIKKKSNIKHTNANINGLSCFQCVKKESNIIELFKF